MTRWRSLPASASRRQRSRSLRSRPNPRRPRSSPRPARRSSPRRSPYIVRTSFTLAQSCVPMADWAADNGIKKVVTMISDYGPGIDAEKSFTAEFKKKGGDVIEAVRFPARQSRFRALPATRGRPEARCDFRIRSLRARRHFRQAVRRARPRQSGHQDHRSRRRDG